MSLSVPKLSSRLVRDGVLLQVIIYGSCLCKSLINLFGFVQGFFLVISIYFTGWFDINKIIFVLTSFYVLVVS